MSLSSFRNTGTQHCHLLPAAPQPSGASHHPAAFLVVQPGFCSSTHIPSNSNSGHPSTFNGHLMLQGKEFYICLHKHCTGSQTPEPAFYSDFPLPSPGSCSTWCLACHVLSSLSPENVEIPADCLISRAPDPWSSTHVSCYRNGQGTDPFLRLLIIPTARCCSRTAVHKKTNPQQTSKPFTVRV